jgi:CBS domain-containing protein
MYFTIYWKNSFRGHSMPRVKKRHVLSGITVKEAMRRQVIKLPQSAPVDYCINRMIKYKINSVLLIDGKERPSGIVSKTDIMSAFYAGFPIQTPVEDIMVGPPLYCYPDDELESSLDAMHHNRVHRLYVLGADAHEVIGVLAYPDIVGLLYRYCRACDKGLLTARRRSQEDEYQRLKVKDVMTASVTAYPENEALVTVIEGLTEHRCGAVLITDAGNKAVGVVSKSDLIVAYKHGVAVDVRSRTVMSTPVKSCHGEAQLSDAIQQMLLRDVQRIFVHASDSEKMVGVLSLSDAARFRSGSCRACTSSRLIQQ